MDDKKKLNIILGVLALVVVGYLLYTFLFSPIFKDISEADVQLLAKQAEMDTYMAKADSIEKTALNLLGRINTLDEKATRFLPDLDRDKILNLVDTVSSDIGIKTSAVYFSDVTEFVPDIGGTEDESAATEKKDDAEDSGEDEKGMPSNEEEAKADTPLSYINYAFVLPVNIRFNAVTYAQAIAFMRALEEYDRTIYFSSASYTISANPAAAATGAIDIVFDYNFYAIKKLTLNDSGFVEPSAPAAVGKTDPFV